MASQWTLIVFTFLVQLSMGIMLCALLAGVHTNTRLYTRLVRLALAACGLGLLASLLHLNTPWRAPYSITQWGHSWLSREILLLGLFAALLCWQFWRGHTRIMEVLTAVAGLGTVLAMSQVYQSTFAVPLWNNMGVTASFVGTALALGGACILLLAQEQPVPRLTASCLGALATGAILSLCLPVYWFASAHDSIQASQLLQFKALALRLVSAQGLLLLLGLGGFIVFSNSRQRGYIWVALLCVFGGTLTGRILFFAANLRMGV